MGCNKNLQRSEGLGHWDYKCIVKLSFPWDVKLLPQICALFFYTVNAETQQFALRNPDSNTKGAPKEGCSTKQERPAFLPLRSSGAILDLRHTLSRAANCARPRNRLEEWHHALNGRRQRPRKITVEQVTIGIKHGHSGARSANGPALSSAISLQGRSYTLGPDNQLESYRHAEEALMSPMMNHRPLT